MTQIIKVTEPLLQVVQLRDQPTMIVQVAPVQINNSGVSAKQASLPFSYGDVTTQTIYAAIAGQRITRVDIGFDIAFNVTSSLKVGDGANIQRLMDTGQNNPSRGGIWTSTPFYKYSSNTNILLTLSAGIGCTQGSGVVIIYYE
jgi:hypothetical protein